MVIRNRNINKRMNWFDRQFLRAQDFTDEQDYHLDRGRRHNRRLHTPGVAEGLLVNGVVGSNTVTVTSGMAINPQGFEIVLRAQVTLTLPTGADRVEFYILYGESESDPSSDPGVVGNTRINEAPTFVIRRTQPSPQGIPTDGILLAEAQLNSATGRLINNAPNNGVRIMAAAVVDNDITVFSLTLKRNGVPPAQWPRLSCSAANQAALENASLRLDANREIFFADGGQIRSFNNFHRLVFDRQNNRMELHELGDILFLTGNPPAEKMRVLANGNVGVGIQAPVAKLQIINQNQNANGNTLILGPTNQSNLRLGYDAEYSWIQSHGSKPLSINPLGNNVGIGTISPRARLEVLGGAIMPSVGNTNQSGIQFPNDPGGGAGDEAFIRYFPVAGENTKLLIGINNDPNDSIGLWQSGAERLSIINGNVGVGTTAPRARLEVLDGAIMPSVGNTNQSGIQFPPNPGGGAGDEAFIRYFPVAGETTKLLIGIANDADDSIGLFQAGAERLTVINGNVGIGGTPSAVQRLHVFGNLRVEGNISTSGAIAAGGGKGGYVMDKFINSLGETLEEGDVVVIGASQKSANSYGTNDRIPIPEVDLAEDANDTRVCGIVCEVSIEDVDESNAPSGEEDGGGAKTSRKGRKKASASARQRRGVAEAEAPPTETEEGEPTIITKIAPGQIGFMVTLGAFAHCKVDADIAPIKVGDLLTTSPTRGHAQKVKDPAQAIGAIIGKALGALKKGKGKIPVMVMLQ